MSGATGLKNPTMHNEVLTQFVSEI